MKSFQDNSGQAWTLRIDVRSIQRVKAATGVNLLAIDRPTADDPETPLFSQLSLDELLLCAVIFALLYTEKESRGISDDDLASLFEGEVVGAAIEAFWGALIDFFQKRGRKDTARMLTANLNLISQAIGHMDAKIGDLEQSISRELSTSGLESLESIRALSHSEN